MLFHKGLRKQWKHYITGTVNKFKSNPQTISWKGSEVLRPWVSALQAKGDKQSAHVRMAAGDSAQRIPSGCLWITAWPSSVSAKNKPHAGLFLWSRDGLRLPKCGKRCPKVCSHLELPQWFTPLVIPTSRSLPLMLPDIKFWMFTLCDDTK